LRPLVGISTGDPAGIGPEVTLKALCYPHIYDICKPLVIGDARYIEKLMRNLNLNKTLSVKAIREVFEDRYSAGIVNVYHVDAGDLSTIEPGRIQPGAGRAAITWVRKAVELALSRNVDAVCTAPVNKEAIVKAGYKNFKGHTEFLGEMCGVSDPLTMFVVGKLRIFFLTRHLSLREAIESVTYNKLIKFIPKCAEALISLGLENPKIAVAGLNPHCGEGGLFGAEEETEIEPAVRDARARGYNVVGPIPADSVFYQAKVGKWDAVISLYHDQGHIAAKTLDFQRTVSVTLGLPFIRTSVDHGTAFDIAGKGIASETSMLEAIKVAALCVKRMFS